MGPLMLDSQDPNYMHFPVGSPAESPPTRPPRGHDRFHGSGHNGRYWDGVGIRVVKVFPGDQLLTEVVLQDVDVVYSCSVDPEYVFVREPYTEFGGDPSDYQLAIVRLYNGRPVAAVLSSRREGVKVLQTTIFSGMMRARVR